MTDPLIQLTDPAPPTEAPAEELAAQLKARVQAIEARVDRRRSSAPAQQWHLAQLNLGVFRAPLDAPEMQPFVEALDRINAIADTSPGFIWRLTDDDGGPSSNVSVPGATDPLLASNLSVWTDLESLRAFMYRTDHASYMRRRVEWFQRDPQPMIVAWWIPAGTLPSLEEALQRLDNLRQHGPSDEGFPLGRTIPPAPNQSPSESEPTMALIPYLAVNGAREALAFYAEVFGAEQSGDLFEMGDGRVGHAEMKIDGQTVFLSDEFQEMDLYQPASDRKSPVAIVINVDDVDAVYAHALAAGATGERPPANQHGFRSGWFVDPWGHRWSPTGPEKMDA